MPDISYTCGMRAARPRVWEFVQDINNWAPFTRGYQAHEILNDRESVWTVKGDLGPISRVTRFHVSITEWVVGERVGFEVNGLNEPITGKGAIQLSDRDGSAETEIRGEATLNFGGSMGPVINQLIVPFVHAGADELVTKIVLAITGEQPIRSPRKSLPLAIASALWRATTWPFRALFGRGKRPPEAAS